LPVATRTAVHRVVLQHADDAIALAGSRPRLLASPNVRLLHLTRADHRLAAHLDGLAVAGAAAWPICESALESPGPGEVFVAAVAAILASRADSLARLFALAETVQEARPGLLSAFGWVDADHLRGMVIKVLGSANAFEKLVGLAACVLHRVVPGSLQADAQSPSPELRARALRAAGELGRVELLRTCSASLTLDDAAARFWAAWSAVLLGDRSAALDELSRIGTTPSALRGRAFRMALQVMDADVSRALLAPLASDADALRWAIQGAGITGEASYVSWLVGYMSDDKLSRAAGEAFSLITGADLALLDLERKPPEGVESGPTDNPSDPNVDMDQDDGLPWPDPARVESWWAKHQSRFTPGNRYFLGESATRAHCTAVLKNGYQRQRVLAAQYLCLLEPGTVLFNTSAPAWRQQQLLGQLN
jgi:uncharacterized protein (TIGR02270 family)